MYKLFFLRIEVFDITTESGFEVNPNQTKKIQTYELLLLNPS